LAHHELIVALEDQGPNIAAALAGRTADGAIEDQGAVTGYASDEAADCMPISQTLASKLCAHMDKLRQDGSFSWLSPDARVQVTLEYKYDADGAVMPIRVRCVAIQYSHSQDVKTEKAEKDLIDQVVKAVVPDRLLETCQFHLTARSRRSGSQDSGLGGRRSDADTYGGWISTSSGSLSGRSSLTRSAAYGARWAARSLVAAQLCRRCTVQLTYVPGRPEPLVQVQTFGASRGRTDAELAQILKQHFDFRCSSLKRDLELKEFQFQRLSAYGHFGRADLDLPWEKPKALK